MTDTPSKEHPLRAAAELLGVVELVEAEPTTSEDLYKLRLAAAVCGAADGYALRHASTLAEGTGDDPVEIVSKLRFTSVGMAGKDPEQAALMWAIWTLRQAQTRVAQVHGHASDPELDAACAALHAVHGLLSASVHRFRGYDDDAQDCLEEARRSLATIRLQ